MPFLLGHPQLVFLEALQLIANMDATIRIISRILFTYFIKSIPKLNYFHKQLLQCFDKWQKN